MVMEYTVIECTNCGELTFIRSNQKTFTCKSCSKKNQFKKIKAFSKAKDASEYIRQLKTPPLMFNPWNPFDPFGINGV